MKYKCPEQIILIALVYIWITNKSSINKLIISSYGYHFSVVSRIALDVTSHPMKQKNMYYSFILNYYTAFQFKTFSI